MHDKAHLLETTLSREIVYKGSVITVENWAVRLSDGGPARRDIVRHIGGVAVVAVDDAGMLYMVEQYRAPFEAVIREIPAGKRDSTDEDPALGAARELEEETGLRAERLELLNELYVSPGYCTERIFVFMAHGLSRHEAHLDEDEFIDCLRVPFKDALEDVLKGRLTDAKTVAGILAAARKLGL